MLHAALFLAKSKQVISRDYLKHCHVCFPSRICCTAEKQHAYEMHMIRIILVQIDILATCQMEVATCVDSKMRHDKSLNMDGLKALKILEAIFPWPQRLHVMAWFLWNPGSAQDARPTSRSVRVVRPVGSLFRRKGQCGCGWGWWLCRDGIWCARARYCPHISLPLQRIPLIYF